MNENIHCITISDAAEAISFITSAAYTREFIFPGVNMQKMNGIDCLRILKGNTSEKNTMKESKNSGAGGVIVKPAKTSELRNTLAQIFNIVPELIHATR